MRPKEFKEALVRKKNLSKVVTLETSLKKCLSTLDLVSLGMACTLSSGIYVIIGEIIRNYTGPAVVISFLIAAIASALAAFSYAEFGARVPRAGSAYTYCYVAIGEVWAYVVGWNLILEYVIGAASTAKSISFYLNSLSNHSISSYLRHHTPLNIPSLSPYPDFVSFSAIIILTVIVCFGVHESTLLNNIFVTINLLVLAFIVVVGGIHINFHNWNLHQGLSSHGGGQGGFLPFGLNGVFEGASICFYSFIGFDVITIAGEESVSASKSVPVAIACSLAICTAVYLCISSILTLMVPYYLISPQSPISSAFHLIGWTYSAYITDAGAILCLSSCMLSYMIAMPRIFYAMASDGLLFRFLAVVNNTTKTPVYSTIVAGLFTATLAMFLELIDLVNMMSIGTLLAYTLVSFCVLWLRYKHEEESSSSNGEEVVRIAGPVENTAPWWMSLKQLNKQAPSKHSQHIFLVSVFLIVIMTAASTVFSICLSEEISTGRWWALLLFVLPSLTSVACFVVVCLLPKQRLELSFKVPLVPCVPLCSIVANVYLMVHLSSLTWIRFVVWMLIGSVIYFSYGMHWSSENSTRNSKEGYTDMDKEEGGGGK